MKRLIRMIDYIEAESIASEIVTMDTENEIRAYLSYFFNKFIGDKII